MDGASSAPAPVLQTLSVSQGVSQGLLFKKFSLSILRTHCAAGLKARFN